MLKKNLNVELYLESFEEKKSEWGAPYVAQPKTKTKRVHFINYFINLNGVSDLSRKAFTPTEMHDDPKIYTCRAVRGGKEKLKGSPSKDKEEPKGCLLIRYLWTQGTNIIYNMRVVNIDATS